MINLKKDEFLPKLQNGWLLIVFFIASSTYAVAQDTATVSIEEAKVAQNAADAWLALIDDTNFAESWEQASTLFQEQVSEAEWEQELESERGPLGPLIRRAPQDRLETATLPDVPEGEYVIVVYESSYTQLEAAVETVTMAKTEDGSWRAAEYEIRPAP